MNITNSILTLLLIQPETYNADVLYVAASINFFYNELMKISNNLNSHSFFFFFLLIFNDVYEI